MKVRELMQRRVHTVLETDDLALVAQIMAWGNVRHLPVTREGEVVGVLSQRDVFAQVVGAGGTEGLRRRVFEAMSAPPQLAAPDDPLGPAVARMLSLKLGCLPVVEGGALVGILTKTDVLARQAAGELGPRPGDRAPVSRLMTRNPVVASGSDLLLDAAARMSQYRVRHLPVVDGEGMVVGILADRDVRVAIGDPRGALDESGLAARLQLTRVEDAMTRAVETVREDQPVSRVFSILLERRVGAVPVVDTRGRLTGIVSYLDALGWLAGDRG